MTDHFRNAALLRGAACAALSLLTFSLAGCADMSDNMTSAFADPAKYELYDCKQLEAERKNLATREAELQGLMAKAETGFAGPVVAQVAYSNDYIAVRGQAHFAEEAWRKNNCHASPPPPAVKPTTVMPTARTAAKKPKGEPKGEPKTQPMVRSRSDTSVY